MEKLNITFCSFPDFGGNAKALYEYMVKKNLDRHNYVWIVYNEESVDKLKAKGINAILIGTDEFKDYIKNTDVFFTTQGNLDGDKTDRSLYVELWHGIGPKPVGYACKNPSEEDVRGYNNMRKIIDYVIVPSDFWQCVYSQMLLIESKRIKTLGMPLFDYFKYSNGKENLSKVLGKDLSKYDKIMVYMPTYKNGFNHSDVENLNTKNIFNFKEYDENTLDNYLKENNYLLCVKRHPGDTTEYTKVESDNIVNINDAMLLEHDLSVNEIINAFDLMITDYSSIGTEFDFLKRPVLYALGDYEEYQKNRGIIFSDMDFWTIGPVAVTIEDFLKESKKLLTDDNYFKKEREEKYHLWFGDCVDGGCDKIYNFLFDNEGNINKDVHYYKNPEIMLRRELDALTEEHKATKELLHGRETELELVYNSKGWQFLEKMRKIKNIGKKKEE